MSWNEAFSSSRRSFSDSLSLALKRKKVGQEELDTINSTDQLVYLIVQEHQIEHKYTDLGLDVLDFDCLLGTRRQDLER
jgi:hypothetical protein